MFESPGHRNGPGDKSLQSVHPRLRRIKYSFSPLQDACATTGGLAILSVHGRLNASLTKSSSWRKCLRHRMREPFSASDISAANQRHDQALAHSPLVPAMAQLWSLLSAAGTQPESAKRLIPPLAASCAASFALVSLNRIYRNTVRKALSESQDCGYRAGPLTRFLASTSANVRPPQRNLRPPRTIHRIAAHHFRRGLFPPEPILVHRGSLQPCKGNNLWHPCDSMIRSCKKAVASRTMLDSIKRAHTAKLPRPLGHVKGGKQRWKTTLLPTQSATQGHYLRGYFQSPEGLFRQQHYQVV